MVWKSEEAETVKKAYSHRNLSYIESLVFESSFTATDLDHFLPLDLSDRGELYSLRNQLPILLSDGALLKTKEHQMGQWFSNKQNVYTYCAYIKLFEVQLKEIKYNWPKLPEV